MAGTGGTRLSSTPGTSGTSGAGGGTGGSGGGGVGAGGSGGGGSGGAAAPGGPSTWGPYTWGSVTAPAGACRTNPVGTCCDYELCFSPEEARELVTELTGAGGESAGGDGAGGAADAPATCPVAPAQPPQQIGPCAYVKSGAGEVNGACCYTVTAGGCCGRPFVVGGIDRRAALATRAEWLGERKEVASDAELSPALRLALASAWGADALLEHASIASFNWFALELLQLGAPVSLVQAAQQAALDETRHAELCFELASRFGEREVGPGPLCIDGLATRSLAELAAAVLVEGCVGETLAAALAEAQLSGCGDSECREALSTIARDEADHAVLAWRFLRYAVDRGGAAVVARLREALAAAPRSLPEPASEAPAEMWNHYGRLTAAQQHAVVERTWAELIGPAAALLCEPETPGVQLPA